MSTMIKLFKYIAAMCSVNHAPFRNYETSESLMRNMLKVEFRRCSQMALLQHLKRSKMVAEVTICSGCME